MAARPTLLRYFSCLAAVVVFNGWSGSVRASISYTLTDLGTFGGSSSGAYSISSNGIVSGFAFTTGNSGQHAFIYDGTMRDIGTLGGSDSYAFAVNNNGQAT